MCNDFITLYESGIMLAELADIDRARATPSSKQNIKTGERLGPGGLRGLQIRREASKMSLVGSTPIRSRHLFNPQEKQTHEEETLISMGCHGITA